MKLRSLLLGGTVVVSLWVVGTASLFYLYF